MNKTIVMMGVAVLAAQVHAGYQISVKSVVEGDKPARHGQATGLDNSAVMSVDADKARIDFVQGQGPGAGKGGYLITQDAGKTFIMVSPQDKTYMKWDVASMMGAAGALGGMMKMQISDPKVETLLDEAGEEILGYPTRHYKFRTSYRMAMNVMGFKNESVISREEETWATTKLDLSTVSAWFNNMPKLQNEELDKLIKAEKGKLSGVPLKMVAVQTSTDGQGKSSVTRTLMTVTAIKKIGAGEVSVEIPAGYREINLMAPEGVDEGGAPQGRHSAPPKVDFGSLMRKAMESAR